MAELPGAGGRDWWPQESPAPLPAERRGVQRRGGPAPGMGVQPMTGLQPAVTKPQNVGEAPDPLPGRPSGPGAAPGLSGAGGAGPVATGCGEGLARVPVRGVHVAGTRLRQTQSRTHQHLKQHNIANKR